VVLSARWLPAYVHYRNYVRGHRALGGKPSITRLNEEHSRTAPADVLDNLESYACCETGRRILSDSGSFRMFNREAHADAALANKEVILFESLEGLEARVDGQSIAILRDCRAYTHLSWVDLRNLPPVLNFEPCNTSGRPRIAVANRLRPATQNEANWLVS